MRNLNYLQLIITCGKNQAIALLETSDDKQVKDLIKIIHNLELNSSILSHRSKKILKSYNKLIRKLTNSNNSKKKNYSLIRNNSKQVYNLLSSAKSVLSKVLK
jgi:hypothetical protein